jgi:hypothetical protein
MTSESEFLDGAVLELPPQLRCSPLFAKEGQFFQSAVFGREDPAPTVVVMGEHIGSPLRWSGMFELPSLRSFIFGKEGLLFRAFHFNRTACA